MWRSARWNILGITQDYKKRKVLIHVLNGHTGRKASWHDLLNCEPANHRPCGGLGYFLLSIDSLPFLCQGFSQNLFFYCVASLLSVRGFFVNKLICKLRLPHVAIDNYNVEQSFFLYASSGLILHSSPLLCDQLEVYDRYGALFFMDSWDFPSPFCIF